VFLRRSTKPEGPSIEPGDPRLEGWYHTIELAPSIVTQGEYDHRPVLERFDLPESLVGKRALDVGTADGFFAFELESRGAEVVALDIAGWDQVDTLPQVDVGDRVWRHTANFELAKSARGSAVRRVECNVYDLSPEVAGVFDVVYCGSLLLHLQNPLRALCNIRSVTRELAIIENAHQPELERVFPDSPVLRFGAREIEEKEGTPLGSACIYWWMNRRALAEMLAYAGFAHVDVGEPFGVPPSGHRVVVAHARP
jgi:tRNA (mo5U34)-methyltransferase